MKRLVVLLLAAGLLAPATAFAQGSGNDLLPPVADSATPAPSPTATPTPVTTSAQDTSRTTLYAIGTGLIVLFVGIGWWIARDARRAVPEHERRRRSTAEPLPADGTPRPRSPQAKQRARARGKAQRRARRHNRPHRP